MGYRYVFNLQQQILLLATVCLSECNTNSCSNGGIFLVQPRKHEERCWLYFLDNDNEKEDPEQWSLLLRQKGLGNFFCDDGLIAQHAS